MGVSPELLARAQEDFVSARASEDQVKETVHRYYDRCGYVMCPHTACGVSAVDQLRSWNPFVYDGTSKTVVLATAHPGKFNEAVAAAIGKQPELPPALAACRDAETRCSELPN